MQIESEKVVILNYKLTNDAGDVIDQSNDGQFAYLHGAGNIIKGLESALLGKQAGESVNVRVEPAEAYGERDDRLTQNVTRDMFPENQEIEVGMQFQAQSPEGDMMVITISEVDGDNIVIDGNHPLAGVHLTFDVEILEVRDASAEELDHGHVHGPGGHQH